MGILELLFIGVGLSMDAFAVALCKGLAMKKPNSRHALVIALYFGGFQALMPFIGWLFGRQFETYIVNFDHWIAFFLLAIIGGKMVFDALHEGDADDQDEACSDRLDLRELLGLAVATSIDALAVGVTFAFLKTNIGAAVSIIGVTTFAISLLGVAIGRRFGAAFKQKAELAGGLVLIGIGLKILIEHLFFA